MLRIALASPPVSGSIDAAMPWVERFIAEAADGKADILPYGRPGLLLTDIDTEAASRIYARRFAPETYR